MRRLIYSPLREFLSAIAGDQVQLSFSEIEEILGRKLPPTAFGNDAWWTNNPVGHSQAKAWLAAGFETADLDRAGQTVTFRRVKNSNGAVLRQGGGMSDVSPEFKAAQQSQKTSKRSPLWGALKGTFTIAPGYDLTSPIYTDEEWAEIEKEMEADWDQIEQGLSGGKT
jgi:hypothetical protein